MAIAPLRSPLSASEAAATIRPSARTSGSGELCRSSPHSSATFFGLSSARWQSMRTGRCSVESLERAVRVQVAGGLTPAAAPVRRQAGQLAHGGHARCLVCDRLDGPQRILEAAPLVGPVGRLGPLDQPLPVLHGRHVRGVADVGRDLGRQRVARREGGDGLSGARARAPRLVAFGSASALRPWGRRGPRPPTRPGRRRPGPKRRDGSVAPCRGGAPVRRRRRGRSRCRRASKSPSRRVTSRAPRRATLPHCFARLGNGCSSSRVRLEVRARGPSPEGVRVVLRCGGRPRGSLADLESGAGTRRSGASLCRCRVPAGHRSPRPDDGAAPPLRASPVRARPGSPGAGPRCAGRLGSIRRCLTRAGRRCRSIGSTVVPCRPPAAPRPCAPLPRPAPPDPPARVPGRAGRAGRAGGRDDSAGGSSEASVDSTRPSTAVPRRRRPVRRRVDRFCSHDDESDEGEARRQRNCVAVRTRCVESPARGSTCPSKSRPGPKRRDPLEPKLRGDLVMRNPGGDLLSQGASPQVPSARAGLTAVFGMGTGVSPPLWPPETVRSAAHHPFTGWEHACGCVTQPLSVPKRARARIGLQALGRLVPVG